MRNLTTVTYETTVFFSIEQTEHNNILMNLVMHMFDLVMQMFD